MASEYVDSLLQGGDIYRPIADDTGTIRGVAILDDGPFASVDFELISHRVYDSFGQLTAEYLPDIDLISGSPLPF